MTTPTESQITLIRKLISERRQTLAQMNEPFTPPQTTSDASVLINRLFAIPRDAKPVDQTRYNDINALVTDLRTRVDTLGSSKSFALSLIDQFDRKRDLSDKQVEALKKLSVPATPDPEAGFYKQNDGASVIMAYRSRNKHMTTKTWYEETNYWSYTGRAALADCTPDKLMTHAQVAELGRTISGDGKGMCFVCLAEGRDPTLTDARSIAAGYGATCASRYGWPYPSKQEAEAILREKA